MNEVHVANSCLLYDLIGLIYCLVSQCIMPSQAFNFSKGADPNLLFWPFSMPNPLYNIILNKFDFLFETKNPSPCTTWL